MLYVRTAFDRVLGFVRRQKPNYQVGVTRASGTSFLTGLTSQFNAIYAVALGANSVQLGLLSTFGNAISALISIPVGWAVDRRGVRPFVLAGIGISALAAGIYALAGHWHWLIAAAILASISTRFTGSGSSVICADSVQNYDRATAQNVCGTMAAIVSMIAPLLAASLVIAFGGMTAQGIRPLYYLQVGGYALILLFVASKLREPLARHQISGSGPRALWSDFRSLLAGRPALRRWIAISALSGLPMAMF
jgi:MFS family permease